MAGLNQQDLYLLAWHILFFDRPSSGSGQTLPTVPARTYRCYVAHSTQHMIYNVLPTKSYTTVHYAPTCQATSPGRSTQHTFFNVHEIVCILHTLALHQVHMPTGPGTTFTQAYSKFPRAYDSIGTTPWQIVPPAMVLSLRFWRDYSQNRIREATGMQCSQRMYGYYVIRSQLVPGTVADCASTSLGLFLGYIGPIIRFPWMGVLRHPA